MDRRRYMELAGTVGIAGLAGCGALGTGGETTETPNPYASPDTYLDAPERDGPPEAYPHPVHGDDLPEVTLSAPLHGTEVTTTQFDRPVVLTFFYSNCQTACPVLISALRNTQAQVEKDGHSDEVAFLPISFDPQRDTESALREYVDRMNVDREVGNWYFLRPEDRARARAVVDDTFGVLFQRTTPTDMDRYMFNHSTIVLLVNSDGVIERAYRDVQSWKPLYEDFQALREARA